VFVSVLFGRARRFRCALTACAAGRAPPRVRRDYWYRRNSCSASIFGFVAAALGSKVGAICVTFTVAKAPIATCARGVVTAACWTKCIAPLLKFIVVWP